MAAMGEAARPRALFLAGLAAVYVAAFGSLYVQIPGLYGREGILPARRVLRLGGKGPWERLQELPTLLWLGPRLGLDTEQGMELLCLLGLLGALGALLCERLRDCLLFALLRVCYLSLYQVGQVFLYFQWDSLLLEAGFLAVLVAPLRLLRRGSPSWRPHDAVTFWGVRWLLFRLMFASGVVKLSSRCPTWWGLTALTYHYESQCLPTPGAWLAHQLPVWLQKLSVVATYVIEVAVPRSSSRPCAACASSPSTARLAPSAGWLLATLLELGTYGLLLYWTVRCFGLELDWDRKVLESRVAFTYHEFSAWLRAVTLPLVGAGVPLAVLGEPGRRLPVVSSYGLFRRMTGVGGRPEVILEGSYDGHSWTEIEFMYKPGNVSAAPAVVAPHQPRLDWQLWFAALAPHQGSPWFSALVLRLLQGQRDVIRLVQTDESRYPFHARPPTFVRAQLYKYWFTAPNEGSPGAAPWWRRQHVQEFFPAVSLGHPTLESLLSQHGLKVGDPCLGPETLPGA
ncbi:hypothetical protein DUI87_33370 [Hirundo rustica rustica]|uniref:Lipase maturation factor n=1 Tax=Hirundo rustica rustica TaxID=333673 RepID=A0A3M0IN97_HIRRU|nr:hypothetical protein DUI87_33370 [Hirundo rustica rustica]